MPTTRKKRPPEWHEVSVISTPLDINRALKQLSRAQVQLLADVSRVPFTTLYQRSGSRDMMLSHAHAIAKHLPAVRAANLPGLHEAMAWRRMQRARVVEKTKAEARAAISKATKT